MRLPIGRRVRGSLGSLLRRIADRIDDDHAPRYLSSYSFTFERHKGLVLRDDGRGCPLMYLDNNDYARAHAEADAPL